MAMWREKGKLMQIGWNITDQQSTLRYFISVAGNLVTQRVKSKMLWLGPLRKPSGIAYTICEFLWLRVLLKEIGFKPKAPMLLYCDNQAA